MRSDRLSAIEQWGLDRAKATLNEHRLGIATDARGETEAGLVDLRAEREGLSDRRRRCAVLQESHRTLGLLCA
jgi:hypothetical protein